MCYVSMRLLKADPPVLLHMYSSAPLLSTYVASRHDTGMEMMPGHLTANLLHFNPFCKQHPKLY